MKKLTLTTVNGMLNELGLFAVRCGGGVFEICLDAHQTRLLNPHPERNYRGAKRGECYTCINECHSLQEVLGYFRGAEQAKRLIAEGIRLRIGGAPRG